MGVARRRGLFAACLAVAVCVAGLAGPGFAASRNRQLDRLLEKSEYSTEEGDRFQRALAAAIQAGVEERDALAIVKAAADDEFGAAQVLRLLTLASQLALEGLPVDGFAAKVEEGAAKHVDADRVVQAAERRALMLNKARVILNALVLEGFGARDRDELLPDLAAALEAGRSPEEATAILADGLRDGDSPGTLRRKLFP
jgi:hypothetical protein